MTFFDRVKSLAKSNKTTIESVVNNAGISIDSYNSYRRLNNLPRADEAVLIAQTLHTSVEYLVTGTEKNNAAIELAELKKKILEFANSI